jgi:trans-2-enoyl-CoA reductase
MESASVPAAASSQVVVKMLAAPVSEYDMAVVSGRTGPFAGVAGNEGVGIVTSVGSAVRGVGIDDWVVPSAAGLGTFSEYVVTDAVNVQVVPKDLNLDNAALIGGTVSTALRLVSDFGGSKCLIQNAANTGVGQAVVQIAKARGIKTINIIPDSPESDNVTEYLQSLGADIVVTESYASSTKFSRLVADMPTPSLGINGAGGDAATAVARTVGDGSTVVTYGGSAPVRVPTSVLVGKGVTLSGFSLARWHASASQEERTTMVNEIASLAQNGNLQSKVTKLPFSDILSILENGIAPSNDTTTVVTM